MKPTHNNKRPTHHVYAFDGEGEKTFWSRIGAAWPHQDGDGLNISLTAIPLNGRLVVRTVKAKESTEQ